PRVELDAERPRRQREHRLGPARRVELAHPLERLLRRPPAVTHEAHEAPPHHPPQQLRASRDDLLVEEIHEIHLTSPWPSSRPRPPRSAARSAITIRPSAPIRNYTGAGGAGEMNERGARLKRLLDRKTEKFKRDSEEMFPSWISELAQRIAL